LSLRPTALPGVCVLETSPAADDRGTFLRLFDSDLLSDAGLNPAVVQISLSTNLARHTLRGLHWQADPHGETKTVRCLRGAIFDVAVDLRPGPTQHRWIAEELRENDGRALVIPPGVAHGFLTLTDDAHVLYAIDVPHVAAAARGARWNDSAFAIAWPAPPAVISARDAGYPDWPAAR
jgi:dTDP-4-dehydrorhamnose 3,5-epimerase